MDFASGTGSWSGELTQLGHPTEPRALPDFVNRWIHEPDRIHEVGKEVECAKEVA